MGDQGQFVIFGKQENTASQNTSLDKHLTPIVDKPAKLKMRSKKRQLFDEFIVEDGKKVKTYLWNSVVVPSIKDIVWNFFTKGLKMLLYKGGEGPNVGSGSPSGTSAYIAYNSLYPSKPAQIPVYSQPRTSYNYGEVIVDTREKAVEAITQLRELIMAGKTATIGDLYQIFRLPTDFPDFTYGWTDLSDANIVELNDGKFLIKLPRPYPVR